MVQRPQENRRELWIRCRIILSVFEEDFHFKFPGGNVASYIYSSARNDFRKSKERNVSNYQFRLARHFYRRGKLLKLDATEWLCIFLFSSKILFFVFRDFSLPRHCITGFTRITRSLLPLCHTTCRMHIFSP